MGHSCYRKQERTIESESLAGAGNATMAFMLEENTAIADCLLMHTTRGHKQSRIRAERATAETETRENLKEESGRARIAETGILGGTKTIRRVVDAKSEGRKSVLRHLCHARRAEKNSPDAYKKEAGTSSTFARLIVTRSEQQGKKLGCRLLSCIDAIIAGQQATGSDAVPMGAGPV